MGKFFSDPLGLYFLDSILWSTKDFNFHKVQFTYFCCCVFGVTSKNPLSYLGLGRLTIMFSFKSFIVFPFTFRSLIYFEFSYMVVRWRSKRHSYAYGNLVVPAPFMEETISPIECSWHPYWKSVVRVYFWTFRLTTLAYKSVLMPVPYWHLHAFIAVAL